jgi:hypothetical protein
MNNTQMCCECGGYQSGAINMNSTAVIKICSCNNYYSCNRQGWICPKCNKSLSPDVKECDCAPSGYTYIPCVPWNPYAPTNPSIPYYPTTPIWITPISPWGTNPSPIMPIYYLTVTC